MLVCAVIGTTTFDGFSNDVVWRKLEPHLQSLFAGLGFHPTPAIELAYTVGLLLCVALIRGIYELGIRGVQSVSFRYTRAELSRAFAHTLVPIGFAYVLAHYFSLLIWQGQAIGYLASDPLGNGANIFGTATYQIDYTIISFAAIWYVQVAALVAGHVGGLTLAHDRALSMYKRRSGGGPLAVLDADRDGRLHELRAVAAVGGGNVSAGGLAARAKDRRVVRWSSLSDVAPVGCARHGPDPRSRWGRVALAGVGATVVCSWRSRRSTRARCALLPALALAAAARAAPLSGREDAGWRCPLASSGLRARALRAQTRRSLDRSRRPAWRAAARLLAGGSPASGRAAPRRAEHAPARGGSRRAPGRAGAAVAVLTFELHEEPDDTTSPACPVGVSALFSAAIAAAPAAEALPPRRAATRSTIRDPATTTAPTSPRSRPRCPG